MMPACAAEINAAFVVGHHAGVFELLGRDTVLLLGRVNFGFPVSNRPDTTARQLAATASQLAYIGRQVLVGQWSLLYCGTFVNTILQCCRVVCGVHYCTLLHN